MRANFILSEHLELTAEQAELLKVAGFLAPVDLIKHTPEKLIGELENAKNFLSLQGELPAFEIADIWLKRCVAVVEQQGYTEQTPDLRSSIGSRGEIPEAIYLDKNQLRLLKVGPAKFSRALAMQDVQGTVQVQHVHTVSAQKTELEIDEKRVKRIKDYAKNGGNVAPLARDGKDLKTTPKQTTNLGKKQTSRSYVRGVLHPRAQLIWFGAINTLFFYLSFFLSLVSAGVLFMLPEEYEVYRFYLLIAPVLMVISTILFVMVSYRSKCCVCTQRLFVPKNCNKHNQAHRIWGLGYVLPLAFHTVIFRWFRCTFCGTFVRIKE